MEEQTRALQPMEHNNQRILTTAQLAGSYGTDAKHINDNFQRNRDRYSEGKHFYHLEGETLRQFKEDFPAIFGEVDSTTTQFAYQSMRAPVLYLWTEKGALMHAKSLNTDEAWAAYEKLVDEYYRLKAGAYVAPGAQLPLKGELLMLPERVTDDQVVELLSQLETLVKDEQLAPELRSTDRYTLEFALKKAQASFQRRTIRSLNFKDKPNRWGMIRAKEYPDETTKEHEEYNKEVRYRSLQEEHARLEKYMAQLEEKLLDLQVIRDIYSPELEEAFKDMDIPHIEASLQKIMRWLQHMKTPEAPALKLLLALQEKIVQVLQNNPDGLNVSALSQKCHLGKDEIELVLEELVSKKAIRLDQRKVAARVKRTYKAKGA